MNKKKEIPKAKIFQDRYKINCVECVRCEAFIPNVKPNVVIMCANCKTEFETIE